MFFIVSGQRIKGGIRIEVKDLLGRIIFTNFINELNEYEISAKEWSNGIYLVQISNSEGVILKDKLIKQE